MYAVTAMRTCSDLGDTMSETTRARVDDPARESGTASQPGTGARGSGRKLPWPWLAALAVVAIAVVAGALLWSKGASAPERVLEQMAAAAESKDWGAVQRYMDVDAVASGFIDVALDEAFGGESSGTVAPAGGMGTGKVGSGTAMRTKSIEGVKATMKAAVANAVGSKPGVLSSVLFTSESEQIEYLGEDVALVTVEIPLGGSETQPVVLRMERADRAWRITAFENARELLTLPF